MVKKTLAHMKSTKNKEWDTDSDNADPALYVDIDPYTQLSWDKVEHEVNMNHPRRSYIDKEGKKQTK